MDLAGLHLSDHCHSDAKAAASAAAFVDAPMPLINMPIMNPEHRSRFHLATAVFILLLSGWWTSPARAQADKNPLPHFVTQDGRHALIVDGAPFLILGAQSHNSSAWPAMLPKVWPAIDSLHANTLEIPIYWEQFEPEPGRYDTSILNTIIEQAREHDVRLVVPGSAPGRTAVRIDCRSG